MTGACVQVTSCDVALQDETLVIRRYYSGVQRGDEVINVRDSVLLKSGTRKKDQPFVARVSGLWEEDEGESSRLHCVK